MTLTCGRGTNGGPQDEVLEPLVPLAIADEVSSRGLDILERVVRRHAVSSLAVSKEPVCA